MGTRLTHSLHESGTAHLRADRKKNSTSIQPYRQLGQAAVKLGPCCDSICVPPMARQPKRPIPTSSRTLPRSCLGCRAAVLATLRAVEYLVLLHCLGGARNPGDLPAWQSDSLWLQFRGQHGHISASGGALSNQHDLQHDPPLTHYTHGQKGRAGQDGGTGPPTLQLTWSTLVGLQ